MSLSVDEHRVTIALEKWAKAFDERAKSRPFGFDRVRAKALRTAAAAIRNGKHR